MSMLAVPLIAVAAFCLALIALILLAFSNKTMHKKFLAQRSILESQQLLVNAQIEPLEQELQQLKAQFTSIDEIMLEHTKVTKQLEHRIKVLQEQHQDLVTFTQNMQSQQPEDELYSRASKLVELGADIDEIVRECEIPYAEAEMLLAVHRKKTK